MNLADNNSWDQHEQVRMTRQLDFRVRTQGGVCDLSRVVNTLALLDITPISLTAERGSAGLTIDLRIDEDDRTGQLFADRVGALPAVLATEFRPAGPPGAEGDGDGR